MSQPNDDHIKRWALGFYKQLCETHGTTPTIAQIEEVRRVAGTHKDHKTTKEFEYALLCFLSKSAIVFEEDTLLLGWARLSNGAMQEIWYKLDDTNVNHLSSRLYFQSGATPGTAHKVKPTDLICDEWHPSLAAICAPIVRANPHTRYAYFTATVRLMRASRLAASIHDSTRDRSKLTIAFRRPAAVEAFRTIIATTPAPKTTLTQEHDTVNTGLEENAIPIQNKALYKSDNTAANSTRRTKLQGRATEESEQSTRPSRYGDLERDRKRVKRAVVVDLTESDPEEDIGSETNPAVTSLAREQDDIPAKQKLKDMLQSKKVSEIEDMLAKRSGQLPDWIENIVKQEMEKKMARDLAMVENFF
jgi:hypothetical protein